MLAEPTVSTSTRSVWATRRSAAFLERQLRRMYSVWEQTKTWELPLVDDLHDRLVAAASQRYTGIVTWTTGSAT